MNKIKEIHNELFLEQHSYVNSDRRELFEFYLYEELKKLGYVVNIQQKLLTFWYTMLIVKIIENEIHFREPFTEIELERLNEEIKREVEKEGRCKIEIKQDRMSTPPTMKIYCYIIPGMSGPYARAWKIRKK